MFFVVDLIIIAIILLCVAFAYKRGLTGCVIKLLAFVIAIAVAFTFFKPFSNIIVDNTEMDEKIQTSIVEVFEKDNSKEDEKENKSPIIKSISEEIENATEEKKTEIVNNAASKISINIINVISFIILFIVARIALMIVEAVTDLITKLPLIKQCDKIGGVIYGILQGLVIVFILLALITFISTIINNYTVMELISNSYIGSMLCDYNILINLIF